MPRAKPKRETADQRIELRVTSTEAVAYRRKAVACGLTLSDWIREAADVKLGEASGTERGEIMRACEEIDVLIERIRDAV